MKWGLCFIFLALHAATAHAEMCGTYTIEDDKVFYAEDGVRAEVKGAESSDFVPFFTAAQEGACMGAARFGHDKKSIFFHAQKIAGSDVASFKVLERLYSKDKSAVYLGAEKIIGADPASFVVKDAGRAISEDAQYLFCGRTALTKEGLLTFSDGYMRDTQTICHNGKIMEGFDAPSFTYLGRGYAYDANGVYYSEFHDSDASKWQRIYDIDKQNLKLVKGEHEAITPSCTYVKDNIFVYFKVSVVEEADAANFVCTTCPEGVDAPCAEDVSASYRGAERTPHEAAR